MKDDRNTPLKRWQRHATMASAVLGSTVRYGLGHWSDASEKAPDDAPPPHALHLLETLGRLKGPVMKVAQILSALPEGLPPGYAPLLAKLQSQAPPMGVPFVKRRMVAELGPDWRSRFRDFELQAHAAASLGQVHRATTHDGIPVACKLQYPGMEASLDADLQHLKWLFQAYEWSPFGALRMDEVHAELSGRLREELDYQRERRWMLLFRQILKPMADVVVPHPCADLSTTRLLTMTWAQGASLHTVLSWPEERRNHVAEALFRAWYTPLYSWGVLHCDPHPGNWSVDEEGRLNLMDWGCVRLFEPDLVRGILMLFEALKKSDDEQIREAYRLWGFESLDTPLLEALNLWARLFYEPLLDDRVRPVQHSLSAREGRQIAAQVHAALRNAGGVRPPRAFVFLDRVAVALGGIFMQLQARLNWHTLFETCVAAYDPADMVTRQQHLQAILCNAEADRSLEEAP
jgi:predicted unusual protein kinase regulating ubiquinone biosynthesis (AarF/ABC1/UbiB family)